MTPEEGAVEREMIEVGSCPCCGAVAQCIATDDPDGVPGKRWRRVRMSVDVERAETFEVGFYAGISWADNHDPDDGCGYPSDKEIAERYQKWLKARTPNTDPGEEARDE